MAVGKKQKELEELRYTYEIPLTKFVEQKPTFFSDLFSLLRFFTNALSPLFQRMKTNRCAYLAFQNVHPKMRLHFMCTFHAESEAPFM